MSRATSRRVFYRQRDEIRARIDKLGHAQIMATLALGSPLTPQRRATALRVITETERELSALGVPADPRTRKPIDDIRRAVMRAAGEAI